ncbi:MAG: hypothetical protein KKD18_04445 [Nanoarchaeota archaeon]|nr:hypothetical protein [Nanoarchaeota archaeon]MBU0977640.1 hypothetical protein [Nanoarchaeota archaeon]
MKKVLIVGPCYADAAALKKFLESNFSVNTVELTKIKEATDFLKQRSCDFILVTRICIGDKKPGAELIDYVIKNCPDKPIIMLTRFPEAQEKAIKAGAKTAFDMDLLIGFIRPSMEEKRKRVLEYLNEQLS